MGVAERLTQRPRQRAGILENPIGVPAVFPLERRVRPYRFFGRQYSLLSTWAWVVITTNRNNHSIHYANMLSKGDQAEDCIDDKDSDAVLATTERPPSTLDRSQKRPSRERRRP